MLPACVADIAMHYQVEPALIDAVAQIESGKRNVGKIGPNSNGTYDLGVMQVNTWWLTRKGPYSLASMGITERELLVNDCTNIAVGTWVLKQNLLAYGNNVRAALSAYNSGKPDTNVGLAYAEKVISYLGK